MSRIPLDLDRELLDEALRVSGLSSYEEVIHLALRELLRLRGVEPPGPPTKLE